MSQPNTLTGWAEFERQLRALGHAPESIKENRITVPYLVPAGAHRGKEIKLGFEVPDDFPRTPPSGPHISPRIQPINPSGDHPARTHASEKFGPEWMYWSRPFPKWSESDRSVKTYLRYVQSLFATA